VEPIAGAISDTELAQISPTGSEAAADHNRVNSAPRYGQTGLTCLGALGMVLPIGAYFWFIHQYSVNVVYWDQWSDINLLGHWYIGKLTLSGLWAPHGDHRILFPNLIVFALARFTHFNVVFEEYLSGAMLVTAAVFFISTHRRRSPSTPLIYYCPVTLLLFSFVQFQNTLWGFQMAWYLITLALALALFLLDRPALTGWVFAGAIAATVIGSFSSLQGLLIWPVGLLILYVRRRPRRSLLIWIACGLITATVYFYHLHPTEYSNQTYVFSHPIESLRFFLFLIGSVLGIQFTNHPWPEILFGTLVMVIAILIVVKYQRRGEHGGSPIGVALICYGVLFAATITQGRAFFALWAPSRYTACGLLILAGCYLALLDRVPARNRFAHRATAAEGRPERRNVTGKTVLWMCLAVAIFLQVIFGTGHGLASAKSWSQSQKEVADTIVNVDKASNPLVQGELLEGNALASRQLVQTMKVHRLSLFATGAVGYYSRIGLLPELTVIHVRVFIPVGGATLNGTSLLDAAASDLSGVTKVDFRLNGDGVHDTVIGAGKTFYGWIAYLNTTLYPNGSYELQSVAYGYAGGRSYSPTVRISINNHP
jgi:Bacterial Ig domain